MSEHDRDVEMRDEYDFSDATRGPILPPTAGKTKITIRLDNDILEWFRAQVHREGGGNYQTLINRALREAICRARFEAPSPVHARNLTGVVASGTPVHETAPPSLVELVRQLVREELDERLQGSAVTPYEGAKRAGSTG
jgi:uncharacterized protein (DUF4415 family)